MVFEVTEIQKGKYIQTCLTKFSSVFARSFAKISSSIYTKNIPIQTKNSATGYSVFHDAVFWNFRKFSLKQFLILHNLKVWNDFVSVGTEHTMRKYPFQKYFNYSNTELLKDKLQTFRITKINVQILRCVKFKRKFSTLPLCVATVNEGLYI